jgi:hypothetical protein
VATGAGATTELVTGTVEVGGLEGNSAVEAGGWDGTA